MKTNLLKDGALTENSAGLGTVNRKMVRERAVELAVINGRSAQDVSKSDWEVARCVVGVPVSSPETCAEFRAEVDEMFWVIPREESRPAGQFYKDSPQTRDEEVRELLASAAGGGDGS